MEDIQIERASECIVLLQQIKKEVNLAEFIRTFGARLEENFQEWNKKLTQELTKDTK